jgi:hypothetical protein
MERGDEAVTGKSDTTPATFDCPQCGEPTRLLCEGYCEPCCTANQAALDEHNARHDWWAGLTDQQRGDQIRRACQ